MKGDCDTTPAREHTSSLQQRCGAARMAGSKVHHRYPRKSGVALVLAVLAAAGVAVAAAPGECVGARLATPCAAVGAVATACVRAGARLAMHQPPAAVPHHAVGNLIVYHPQAPAPASSQLLAAALFAGLQKWLCTTCTGRSSMPRLTCSRHQWQQSTN